MPLPLHYDLAFGLSLGLFCLCPCLWVMPLPLAYARDLLPTPLQCPSACMRSCLPPTTPRHTYLVLLTLSQSHIIITTAHHYALPDRHYMAANDIHSFTVAGRFSLPNHEPFSGRQSAGELCVPSRSRLASGPRAAYSATTVVPNPRLTGLAVIRHVSGTFRCCRR